jgi:hypothetical protein
MKNVQRGAFKLMKDGLKGEPKVQPNWHGLGCESG